MGIAVALANWYNQFKRLNKGDGYTMNLLCEEVHKLEVEFKQCWKLPNAIGMRTASTLYPEWSWYVQLQRAAQIELWTGQKAPLDVMRKELKEIIREKNEKAQTE